MDRRASVFAFTRHLSDTINVNIKVKVKHISTENNFDSLPCVPIFI